MTRSQVNAIIQKNLTQRQVRKGVRRLREWLKQTRIERGMTQAQIAQALDISEGYYSYIESGERQKKMDITLVMKLSNIFGITAQEIAENEAATA
mgnify:CR=1 FL=1